MQRRASLIRARSEWRVQRGELPSCRRPLTCSERSMPFLPRATTISRSFLATTSYVISDGSVDSSLSFFFSCRVLLHLIIHQSENCDVGDHRRMDFVMAGLLNSMMHTDGTSLFVSEYIEFTCLPALDALKAIFVAVAGRRRAVVILVVGRLRRLVSCARG